MSPLEPSTRYYYRVGCDATGWSSVFSFTSTASEATLKLPLKHLIIGDLGAACGFSMCPACNCSSEICDKTTCAAQSQQSAGGLVTALDGADMILHVGDYGYNLDSNGGRTGDNFMKNMEQLAAYVPYDDVMHV